MKAWVVRAALHDLKSFISHMVQMKVDDVHLIRWLKQLYIPHGSDESSMRYAGEVPHDDLYIPHGSDESYSIWDDETYAISFISHMVQMKGHKIVSSKIR